MTFVGICGGRKYQNWERVAHVIAELSGQVQEHLVIVHGDANGADRLADKAARRLRLDVVRVPALWDEYGKAAGARRNGIIAALPLRYLVAFPGGTGTADMVRKAKKAGIEVIEVRE